MAVKSGRKSDPLVGFNFRLEIEGKLSGYFTEVSGIGSESEIVEQKLTDDKGRDFVQKVPGRLKWENVTLKRGITDKMDIWKWRKLVEDGKMKDARANCAVIMMDRNSDVARWDFVNAWPSKVSSLSIKSDSDAFVIEEVTLVHEGMVRKS